MPGKFRCPCLRPLQKDVYVLDYRHAQLEYVPSDVFANERTLEELYIDSNDIKELPKELFLCHCLRKLTAAGNDLYSIPTPVENLVYLEHLDVSNNGITEIADTIKNLKHLSYLDMSANPVGRLPDGFSQLLNMTELYLNVALLDFLPGSFGRLNRLRILEIRENRLTTLPSSMSRLAALERLDVGHNDLTEIPDWLGSLMSLQELWLDTNHISELPACIGSLSQLLFLDASKNQLQFIDPAIQHCLALGDLHLSLNGLRHLPETLGKLANLTTLKVDDNKLMALPFSIGGLVSLSELHMNINEVTELPPSIGFLRHLRVLYADENLLKELPPEIGSCCGLTVLSLGSNKLTYIPEELGRVPCLRVLNLSDNKLDFLPFSLTRLKELQALWLAKNQNKPIVPLQSDMDPITGQKVLTCYLLPQRTGKLAENEESSDAESFNPAAWEEEWQRKRTIQFDFGPMGEPTGRLQRQPTPYPKEMKHRAQHVRNLAMKELKEAGNHKTETRGASVKSSKSTGTSTVDGPVPPSPRQKGRAELGSPKKEKRNSDIVGQVKVSSNISVKKSLSQGALTNHTMPNDHALNPHNQSRGLPQQAPPHLMHQSPYGYPYGYPPSHMVHGYYPPNSKNLVLQPHELYRPAPGVFPGRMVPVPQEFSLPRSGNSRSRLHGDTSGLGRGYESDTAYRHPPRVKGRSEGYSSDMEGVRVVGRRAARRTEGYSSDAESTRARTSYRDARPVSHGYSSDAESSRSRTSRSRDAEVSKIPPGRHPWHVLYGLKPINQSNYYDPSIISEPPLVQDRGALHHNSGASPNNPGVSQHAIGVSQLNAVSKHNSSGASPRNSGVVRRDSMVEENGTGGGSSDDAEYKNQLQNMSMRIHKAQSPKQHRHQALPVSSTPRHSRSNFSTDQTYDPPGIQRLPSFNDSKHSLPGDVSFQAPLTAADANISVSQPLDVSQNAFSASVTNSPYQRRYPRDQLLSRISEKSFSESQQQLKTESNSSLVSNNHNGYTNNHNDSQNPLLPPTQSPIRLPPTEATPANGTPTRYPWKLAASKTTAYEHDLALFKEQGASQVSSSTDSGYVNSHIEKQMNSPASSSSHTDHLTSSSSQTTQLSVKLVKNPGLGFSIAGGLNSSGNPFSPNDKGIFITKVTPRGPADGLLQSGDKIIQVNGTSFEQIEHAAAVDVLRSANNNVSLFIERKVT